MARIPLAACLAAVVVTLGCTPGFDSQSQVSSLRVLGVQKSLPYAKPGDTVTLRMLLDDGSKDAPRGVKVTWFGGCVNPPGDAFSGCFTQGGFGLGGAGQPPTVLPGEGFEYRVTLGPDIIRDHGRPADPDQVPYGVAFAFFTVCAGDLGPAPAGDPFPVACYGPGGERVGPDGFVAGYTQLFAYDELTNANPIVTGILLDGKAVTPDCIGAACVALEQAELSGGSPPGDGGSSTDAAGDAGSDGAAGPDAGVAAPPDPCADPAAPTCLPRCTLEKPERCPPHTLDIVADPASAELDGALVARGRRSAMEQMWVNYYSTAGFLESDVRLLNDARSGWNDDHAATLREPNVAGRFRVWAVAHDNRGGTEWVRVTLGTRPD